MSPVARRCLILLVLSLASRPSAASQLSILQSRSSGGDRPEVWADVKNLEARGTSGSLRLQFRLATAPYGEQGRYYTVGTGPTEQGLAAGYSRRLAFVTPLDSSQYAPGSYYQTVVVQEFVPGGWADRAGATYTSQYTVRRSTAASTPRQAPPPRPASGTGGSRTDRPRPRATSSTTARPPPARCGWSCACATSRSARVVAATRSPAAATCSRSTAAITG